MADKNYESELESVRADLGALRSDVEKLVSVMTATASEKSQEALNAAKEGISGIAGTAQKSGAEGMAYAETQIEKNPFTSVAAAFGVGLIIGKLLDK